MEGNDKVHAALNGRRVDYLLANAGQGIALRRDAPGGADQTKREYSNLPSNSSQLYGGGKQVGVGQLGGFPGSGSLAASGAFPAGPPSNYSISSFSGEEKRGKKKTKRQKLLVMGTFKVKTP